MPGTDGIAVMKNWPVSFDRGSFVFSDATRTLVARGGDHDFIGGSQSQSQSLLAAVESRLQGMPPRTRLFGALPFDPADQVRLFCSEDWHELDGWPSDVAITPSHGRATPLSESDRACFEANVADALLAFEETLLRKVVLARQRTVSSAVASPASLLGRLRVLNPSGAAYAVGLPNSSGGSRALVGVSPELLVLRRGDLVLCSPLAGTASRSSEERLDRERASELRGSSKNRDEHGIVVEGICRALSPFLSELQVDPEPYLHATEKLWHLRSDIRGKLRSSRTNALELALALHPTAAVGGEPTELALEFLRRREGFSRGFYAGAVGYMDRSGDGEWMVAIRCAEVGPEFTRIFAGAGIVPDSRAEDEFAETEAKMGTMLAALGYLE